MKKTKLRGILIKQLEYSDSSLILRFYSKEQGLIGVLAKGLRKKTEKQQLTNLCEYELGLYEPREAGLWLLYDYDVICDYSAFPTAATWAAAECGLELISQIEVSQDEQALFYQLCTSYLAYLQNVKTNAVLIFWRFFLRIIRQSGVGSPLDSCVLCHKADKRYSAFDELLGGLLCQDCHQDRNPAEHLHPLTPTSSKLLQLMPEIGVHLNDFELSKAEIAEINQVLDIYWQSHHKHELKLKSMAVLAQFY
ncbi:MAG: DNA repair protein RecO [Candidatus Cloacimonas sp.]|jgi:DNA repair protein RecO|nr:DNA repair protein RecO [Candidatus Cloacimonas sp.]